MNQDEGSVHRDKTFSIDLETRPVEGTGGRGSSRGLPLLRDSSRGLPLRRDSSLGLPLRRLLLLLSLRTLGLLLLSATSWLLPGEELPTGLLPTVGPSSEATARLSESLLPEELSLLPALLPLLLLLLVAVSDSFLCDELSLLPECCESLLLKGSSLPSEGPATAGGGRFSGAARQSGSFLCCLQVPECDRRPPLASAMASISRGIVTHLLFEGGMRERFFSTEELLLPLGKVFKSDLLPS